MKKLYLWLFVLLTSVSFNELVHAGNIKMPTLMNQGKSIEAFIPAGWRLIKQTAGDLNKDGLADVAGVLELNVKYERGMEEAPPRILFIAFKEPGGLYRLSVQAEKAILKANEGGVWGDPLEGISVDRGSILITFYGGSNYRWSYIYRFRYQNDGWFLIGATIDNYYTGTGEGTREDYNLLTGIMIKSQTRLQKTVKEETINRGKKPLVNLRDFEASGEFKF